MQESSSRRQSSTSSYDDLIGILEKEFALCSELVSLLQREKDVIVSLNAEHLESLLREKELVASKIALCEESRKRILDSLGHPGSTITEIAALSGAPYRDTLMNLASKFRSVADGIAELNRLNSMLIERSLFHVRSAASFLNSFGINPQSRLSVEV